MSRLSVYWAPLLAISLTALLLDAFSKRLPQSHLIKGKTVRKQDTTRQISEFITLYQNASIHNHNTQEKTDSIDLDKIKNPFRLPSSVEKKIRKKAFTPKRKPPSRNYQLQGTVGNEVATIIDLSGQGNIVKPGDTVDSAKVISIKPGKVILRDRAGRFEIKMEN